MATGDRVLYMPPASSPGGTHSAGERSLSLPKGRTGTILAISGQSALIQFDDVDWPQWAPLARLLPLLSSTADGYAQIALF